MSNISSDRFSANWQVDLKGWRDRVTPRDWPPFWKGGHCGLRAAPICRIKLIQKNHTSQSLNKY